MYHYWCGPPAGTLILCLQMRSAFWRGVALLRELDSSVPDVAQHQGEPAAFAGPSTDAESFDNLPKNVMLLEGLIGKLTDKVTQERMTDLICLS